jgi:choline monooxygenase
MNYRIEPDIKKAETLPAEFYRNEKVFERLKERVFGGCWHWLGDESICPIGVGASSLKLLEGFLDEPLLVTRNEQDEINVLSNICTHRAFMILQGTSHSKQLICGYHGRRFDLNGRFKHMPEFGEAEDFPRACDHLPSFDLEQIGSFLFTSLDPLFDLKPTLDEIEKRIGFLPLDEFGRRDDLSKDYLVNAHWALYCDNYLEGFHIPFVHADLNAVLDYGSYETICYDHMNLQIGYSSGGEEVFDLPHDHMDYGKEVAAYYFWIFPNLMLNFYPWGLSVNVVKPINMDKTKVSFITYVYDESKLHSGAGALLDKVEREDEFVVEGVHLGLKSKHYRTGRFSPTREQGVHHFHSLLAKYVSS